MTRQRRHGEDTAFVKFVRGCPELDSRSYRLDREDIDHIWHEYMSGKLMLIEEKRGDEKLTGAQRDTLGILNQALKYACPKMLFERLYARRPRRIRYYGYHVVRFYENGRIAWDGRQISEEELVRILQFQKPRSPAMVSLLKSSGA